MHGPAPARTPAKQPPAAPAPANPRPRADGRKKGKGRTTLALRSTTGTCLACGIPDPPPEQACTLGLDHYVGPPAGCPACGRLTAACAARPCSAARSGRVRGGAL